MSAHVPDAACPETGRPCLTLVPLKEHLESRLMSMDKAIKLAEETNKVRLDLANETRGQLKDQLATCATRAEVEALRVSFGNDIRILREFRAELGGKASEESVRAMQSTVRTAQMFSLGGLLIGIVALVLTVVRMVLR